MNNYSTELIAFKFLTSERSGEIEFSFPGPVLRLFFFPSPFFLYLSQDFKLISLSGPQNVMFSLADVYLIFSSLGGVGEQVLGLIGFTLSMFALIVICFEGVYLIGWERGSQYQV